MHVLRTSGKLGTCIMGVLRGVLCILIASCSEFVHADCPMECTCNSNAKVATCDDSDLTAIPGGFPTGLSILVISGQPSAQFTKFTKLSRSDMKNVKDFEKVVVTYTALTSVDADTFQDMDMLSQLILRDNQIAELRQGTFDSLPNLYLLDLTGNEYCNIEPGALAHIPSLHFLYLGDMKLGHLAPNSFSDLSSLQALDLHGNNLRRVPPKMLTPMPQLKSLDLSQNKFKILPPDCQSRLQALTHLDISSNAWQCNCGLKWMKTLPIVLTGGSHVECYGPESLKYKNLLNVADSRLPCVPPSIACGSRVAVQVGYPAVIRCTIAGDPEPDATWVGPRQVSVDRVHERAGYAVNGSSLRIAAVSRADEGRWQVQATNAGGTDSATVMLEVEEPVTTSTTTTITSSTTHGTTTGSDAGEKGSMMPMFIGAGAGGVLLLTMLVVVACVCHNKKKNQVKPFRRDPDDSDDEHERDTRNMRRSHGNVPPPRTRLR